MTARFGIEGIEYTRTSGRPSHQPVARAGELMRTYPIGNRINPNFLGSDVDNDKNINRRRIAVACSRCRKRKIKCSGDLGNGQGCLNCKNAGTDPSLCQFLRVSSYQADVGLLPTTADYPYTLPPGMNVLPSVNPGTVPGLSPYQTVNSAATIPSSTRLQRYSAPTSYAQALPNSSEYYSYSGNEGPIESYSYQTSSPLASMTSHGMGSSAGVYGNHDQLRQWIPSVQQPGRGGPAAYAESSDMKTPTYLPYMAPACTPGEGQSVFPGLSALANSLPHSAAGDRVLPTPRSNAIPPTSSELSLLANPGYNAEDPIPIKSDVSWIERSEGLPFRTRSESSTSVPKYASVTRLEDQESPYLSTQLRATNIPQSSDTASASDYTASVATTAASTTDQPSLSSQPYSSSYAYTMPSSSRRSSNSKGGSTLLSGQPYTPLPPYRPPPTTTSYHNHYLGRHNREATEAKSTPSTKTSLASVGPSYP